MKRCLPWIFGTVLASRGEAQAPAAARNDLPAQSVALADLSAFRPASANWRIVGAAAADRSRPLALTIEPGVGVLVDTPSPGASGNLSTKWEHGDLDLSLDVMVPKASSSGIYLMGRYEVQLADSWDRRVPTFADLGGIAQRWDDKRREAYDGIPPRLNASRAPGLWQHVEISFRAPKFVLHRKVANARFMKVTVNGVVVQENVEATGPSRGAAFPDERPTGPLVIQGDQGPIALRSIQYKSYVGPVTLASLRYHVFEGEPMDSSYAATHTPVREGDAAAISSAQAGVPDKYAMSYDGTMTVPTTGVYRFQLDLAWIGTDSTARGPKVGGAKLVIDGQPVLVHTGAERLSYADVDLKTGRHDFAMTFYKNRQWYNRDVTLWVEGAGVERQPLHDENTLTPVGTVPNPIVVEPQGEPVLLRSFVRHNNTKRVIALSVADPIGVHFSYDLAQGALLYAWRGPFIETTQMWYGRGEEQTGQPLGSVVTFPGTPALAFLADANAAWPDSLDERELHREGYQLDKAGHPTMLYRLRDIEVADALRPSLDGLSLRRELHLRAPAERAATGLFLQVAQAPHITAESDGSYVIGERSYYIALTGEGARPVIRKVSGHDELLLPITLARGEARIVYTIIW